MKSQSPTSKNRLRRRIPNQEEGMSLLIALMMGLVLMAGVTGLLLRQLMGRKLGAAESYQQMAEIAALNGFNRILSELNSDDSTAYKGYLFTLNHHAGDIELPGSEKWGWTNFSQSEFQLRELCTNRNQLPKAVSISTTSGEPPFVQLTNSTSSQRDDGKANIQLQYRLRGYTTTATSTNNGAGEGRFQIEGIVVRDGDDPGKSFLARTLLLRSLYVNSIVAGEGDWAVLAGQTLSLGDTVIVNSNGSPGEGKVLLNVNSPDRYLTTNGCLPSSLLEDVGSNIFNENLRNRIVPILGQGLPTSSLWNLGLTQDKTKGSNHVRVWSFDDTATLEACKSVVCHRNSNSIEVSARDDLESNGDSVIRLSTSELCEGTGSDCHIFVEHINLTKTRLLIETSANRPVVLHLEYPGTSTVAPSDPGITGSIHLGRGAQLCGVNAGSNTCNSQPEQLILLSTAPKPGGQRSCAATPQTDQYVLSIDGKSLPAATVHLIPGIIKTGNSSTSLNGLIWADGICTTQGSFSLITNTIGDRTVVQDLNEQWQWEKRKFPGYGQMVTRGIRGTGFDTFRRW